MKNKKTVDPLAKRNLTIRINEAQFASLKKMCGGVDGLEIPPALMAATAFTRGLTIVATELNVSLT